MKWSLFELNKHKGETLQFEEILNIKQSLMNREKELLDVGPVKVQGVLSITSKEYVAHFTIQAPLVLPSSRSLEPVAVELSLLVDEIYMTKEQFEQVANPEEKNDILLLEKDVLDLEAAVEDHILLAIPLRVLTKAEEEAQELPKGNDWEVISEEVYKNRQQNSAENEVDPRLAKLSEWMETDDSE